MMAIGKTEFKLVTVNYYITREISTKVPSKMASHTDKVKLRTKMDRSIVVAG